MTLNIVLDLGQYTIYMFIKYLLFILIISSVYTLWRYFNPFRLTSGLSKLTFNNLQKFANLQKFKYLFQYLVIKQNMQKVKTQNVINYTFLKSPCHGEFKYAKIFAKFSKSKFVFKENGKYANSF